jgi:hypothetical protein
MRVLLDLMVVALFFFSGVKIVSSSCDCCCGLLSERKCGTITRVAQIQVFYESSWHIEIAGQGGDCCSLQRRNYVRMSLRRDIQVAKSVITSHGSVRYIARYSYRSRQCSRTALVAFGPGVTGGDIDLHEPQQGCASCIPCTRVPFPLNEQKSHDFLATLA